MAFVIIALGSNLGDRRAHLARAKKFLSFLSTEPLLCSSIYETEPVGVASPFYYYNAVCVLKVTQPPEALLGQLKNYEQQSGRDLSAPRFSDRTIDLDLIDYDGLIFNKPNFTLPHSGYRKRLFVLQPLQEILPDWQDPETAEAIDTLIDKAPKIEVFKTNLIW